MNSLLQEKKELTVKEKLHIVAETLRNNNGITQIKHILVGNQPNHFCAMGLLGFRAGIPIEELDRTDDDIYDNISKKYGFSSYDELAKLSKVRIVGENDCGSSFEQIADKIESEDSFL